MSFRISNFRAIDTKVAELCVVEKCVFSTILVWFGWSLSRGGRYNLSEPPPCTPSPHRYTLTSPTKLHVSFLIIVQLLKMEESIVLSLLMVNHKPKENWKTPIRSTVRSLRRQGMSYVKSRSLLA